jgi:HD-like signal output (HDOD) protein
VSNQAAIRSTIESISSLPTLPVVIDRISRLLENPRTSAEEIGRAITVDQSLASKVLKLVNSAFYGFPGRISTITHAIVILGFSTVKNIVLTASIFDTFRKRGPAQPGFNMEEFWLHSIACGAASQSIARHVGFEEKETCFIAGLIHDIGKIILAQYLRKEFAQTVTTVREKEILFYESERELFDITHQEIGGILAERWRLPPNLRQGVLNHHAPVSGRDHYLISAIVQCADIFVRALDYGNGGDQRIPEISEKVWKDLGMDNVALPALLDSIADEIDKATVFMQVV